LDEKCHIGDAVTVWIKDESILRADGWLEYRKTSLKAEGAPFIIGKEKRKLLGKAVKCFVGVNEKLEPYVVTLLDGYRFSPVEIKAVAHVPKLKELQTVQINTGNGTIFVNPAEERVYLPCGNTFSMSYLPYLKRLIREAGL
jgi:hypothetical protein